MSDGRGRGQRGPGLGRGLWVDAWERIADHARVGPVLEVGASCGCPAGVVLYEAVTWNV